MSISNIKDSSGTSHDLHASKLTVGNIGSATNPVYFDDGVPVKTTYTLGASVPSGAKFTDTVYTHPTYTARTGKPTANQTPAFGGTATVSQITSDATGHVTGATDRTITIPSTLSNGTGTAGLIKTSSTVTSSSGYTACPVIGGVPYYKDTNTTYSLSSFGITATAAELNYTDGVTSNIQTQLNNKSDSNHTHTTLDTLNVTSDNIAISDGFVSVGGESGVAYLTAQTIQNDNSESSISLELNEADNSLMLYHIDENATKYGYKIYGEHNTASLTELSYLSGVTSNIQTQLNGKASNSHTHSYLPLSGGTMTGNPTIQNTNPYVCFKDSAATSYIQTQSGTIGIGSTFAKSFQVDQYGNTYTKGHIFLLETSEQRISFQNASSSKWNVGFYGGSTSTSNVCGMYDWTNSRNVWVYNNSGILDIGRPVSIDNKLTIATSKNIYFGTGTNPAHIGSDANQRLYLAASNETNYQIFLGVRDGIWTHCPHVNGMVALGLSNYKWGQITTTDNVVVSSDRNEKNTIESMDDEFWLNFIMGLQPVTYKFNHGTSDRKHAGMISQDVENLMNKLEMDSKDFAGFIKFQKEHMETKTKMVLNEETGLEEEKEYQESVKEYDEDGNPVYGYGLRYEEFIAPMISVIQKQNREIEELKTMVNELINK